MVSRMADNDEEGSDFQAFCGPNVNCGLNGDDGGSPHSRGRCRAAASWPVPAPDPALPQTVLQLPFVERPVECGDGQACGAVPDQPDVKERRGGVQVIMPEAGDVACEREGHGD